jgi:hypothetical protein
MSLSENDLLDDAKAISKGGEYIATKTIDGMQASLYIYQKGYFVFWYKKKILIKIEKILKKAAVLLYPIVSK